MKSLTNQHWTSLSGEPITGRIPPTLRIMNGVEPTPPQMGEIAHHYKLMTLAMKVSVIPYMVQERTLVDGTRIRMVSSYGTDTVMVWPTGGKKNNFELPHGFVVVTPYSVPRIYMHRRGTAFWSFSDKTVPQAAKGIVSTNQVYQPVRDALPIIMPMVLGDDKFLWDWAAHKLDTSGSTWVPINLEIQQPGNMRRAFHPTHFAGNGKVADRKGAVLFQMEDTFPAWDPEGSSSPVRLPPTTDIYGELLAMQTYRERRWASTDYYDIQHRHVVIKRTGADVYVADRPYRDESFRVPAWAPASVMTNRSTNDLDGDEPPRDELNINQIRVTDPLLGPRDAGVFIVDWSGNYYWKPLATRYYSGSVGYENKKVDLPVMDSMTGMTYERERTGPMYPAPVCIAVLPAPEMVEVVVDNKIFYATSEYMRGGFASATTGGLIEYQHGTSAVTIDRRDSRYSVHGSPRLEMVVRGAEWPSGEYRLFEGRADGALTGKYVTDREMREVHTSLSAGQWYVFGYNLLSGDAQPSWEPKPDPTAAMYGQTATFHLDYEAEILSRDNKAAFAEIVNSPQGWITTSEIREHPSMRGDYAFTSRFIIDFDIRARFLAAIVVEVVCAGAQWGQAAGNYPGALAVTADPEYTVEIRFESAWGDIAASKVLATAKATRPAFEFSTIRRENPYIYPAFDPGKDLIIRMPPEISPPVDLYRQMKNLASGQGTNTHLAAMDFIPEYEHDGESDKSDKGIEFSAMKNGKEIPHRKYVTGQLYVRQFRLNDFPDALWLLRSTACDAPENNFYGPPDGSDPKPMWFYMPELGEAIKNEVFRIEMRDGRIIDWTDAIPAKPGSVKPAPNDRDIKLYRV